MNFFSKIKQTLWKPKKQLQNDWDQYVPPVVYEMEKNDIEQVVEIESPSALPTWLKDDNDIRDEGVIFGLTGAKAEEKVDLIKSIYKRLASDADKRVVHLSEQIGVLNLQIEQIEQNKEEEFKKKEFHLNYSYQPHQMPRLSIAILFTIVALAGAFFLVDFGIKQKITEPRWLIAIGIYFAGLFSVYQRSEVLESQPKHTFWKIIEWYFVPFAAASFVFICALESLGWALSIALFLFIIGAFLVLGRLFFSHINQWTNERRLWKENRENSLFLKKKLEPLQEKITEYNNQINEIRAEKWNIVPRLTEAENTLSNLNSQRDEKIQIFMSEYELAKTVRHKFSSKDIKNIIS